MVSNLARKIKDCEIILEPQITENSLKWCSISLSEVIKRGKRLEASVYDVEAKEARELLMNSKFSTVPLLGKNGLIKNAYYPGRFKRIYCLKNNGIGFYLPSQMSDIYPKTEKYISALTKCSIEDLKIKQNTLLLTRSGTIGNISLVSKTIENKVFSDDVIRITFKSNVDLGYTYTFLKSKIGSLALQTNGYGAVITHIEPEHLAEILIPNPPKELKEKIHNLIIRSFELRDESNDLIDKATKLMIDELQLPPIEDFEFETLNKNVEVQTFSVSLSKINGRLDASYHIPVVGAIVKHFEKYAEEVTTIGDARISKEIILPGRFKRVYVKEGNGRVFIGGKQLFELNPSNKKYLSLTHHGERITKELELHENMTLITCSGTIAKVAIVPKQWENWAANQHIIRVVPTNIDIAGYLSIFLSSKYAYHLITRFTYGSVVDEINNKHVSQIAFPLLKNKETQNEINNLALEANDKRYEAYKLEQQALRIMDNEVIYNNSGSI